MELNQSFMSVNFLSSYCLQTYFGIVVTCIIIVYITGRLSYFTTYVFNYLHWRSLILPFQFKIFNTFLYFLRKIADKVPFITLLILTTEKLHISLLLTSLIGFFLGFVRLAATQEWQAQIPNIKKWKFELGVLHLEKKLSSHFIKDILCKNIKKLAIPNINNKYEISKADFRCYMALSLLFLSVYLYRNGYSYLRTDLIAFYLIAWSSIDALFWNFRLKHKPHSPVENFTEKPNEFYTKYWIRLLCLLVILSFLYLINHYFGSAFSRYNLASFILFFMIVNKFLRIWNEALIAKLNLQKQYYPASYAKNHIFKFENVRIWRDIGSLRSQSIHPFVRLVMFRTIFELSDRSIFIGIITHLDLIVATFFYAILIAY
ncbi:hypothetical protein [Fluviispira sanaruensis]|uniref:Uncharacterized protein n=1 Tax=Fluviispira sanaruensis TaxID=2493639 RepID=A0A4P2VMW7_FLUSA|nr:hypothetical protein [Fluviispira sanaruensis]BBH52859.1 hypothetical protein JCM31447_13020 [Fluviispira sanaruensis]